MIIPGLIPDVKEISAMWPKQEGMIMSMYFIIVLFAGILYGLSRFEKWLSTN